MYIFQRKISSQIIFVFLFCILIGFCTFSIPLEIHAQSQQGYVSISGIPQLNATQQSGRGLVSYLNSLYILVIGLGALLAVIKISLAGVKYAMSDIVTNKAEAKKDIEGALLGLAIILLPYIVLTTINPNLVNLNILGGVNTIQGPQTVTNTPIGIGPGNTTVEDCLNANGSVQEVGLGELICAQKNTSKSHNCPIGTTYNTKNGCVQNTTSGNLLPADETTLFQGDITTNAQVLIDRNSKGPLGAAGITSNDTFNEQVVGMVTATRGNLEDKLQLEPGTPTTVLEKATTEYVQNTLTPQCISNGGGKVLHTAVSKPTQYYVNFYCVKNNIVQ